MIKKYKDISKSLDTMREIGNPKGDTTGFRSLDSIYTVKQGTYLFIQAAPHHGKSELCFEVAFNQATEFNKKSLIYSPETGSVEEIYAEFIHKYTGQPFHRAIEGSSDDRKYHEAINWIDHMFTIICSDDKSYSFDELCEFVTDESIIIAEPYNELKHDMSEFGSRQDLYIEDLIGKVRRYCKKKNKYVIITLHPANQQKEKIKIGNKMVFYYPMPEARGAAGGQALLRKAMTWINMWRPPKGFRNEHGQLYEENEVLVSVEKAKPKGVSKKGTISLFFDWRKNRYYEYIGNKKAYAFQHKGMPLEEVNNNQQIPIFATDLEDDDKDYPF